MIKILPAAWKHCIGVPFAAVFLVGFRQPERWPPAPTVPRGCRSGVYSSTLLRTISLDRGSSV